jgi:hypothetical protein
LNGAEIVSLEIEPRLDLPVGVFRNADRAGFRDAFEPRRDIDAVFPGNSSTTSVL